MEKDGLATASTTPATTILEMIWNAMYSLLYDQKNAAHLGRRQTTDTCA
jgi:uncharacterized membrane protein